MYPEKPMRGSYTSEKIDIIIRDIVDTQLNEVSLRRLNRGFFYHALHVESCLRAQEQEQYRGPDDREAVRRVPAVSPDFFTRGWMRKPIVHYP